MQQRLARNKRDLMSQKLIIGRNVANPISLRRAEGCRSSYSEKNLPSRAFESEFGPDKMLIVHQERGLIDRTLFDLWAETMLSPESQRRRIESQYEGKAIMFSDDCTSHESDGLLDEALMGNVTFHYLPPQSYNKTSALDLGLFGITKQALAKGRSDPQKTAQFN
jgi:hypothetical protein